MLHVLYYMQFNMMLRSKIKRFAPVTYNLNIKTECYLIIKTNKTDRTRNETVACIKSQIYIIQFKMSFAC